MCGFTGFISLSSQPGAHDLRAAGLAMAATLRHRGPDDDGLWLDDSIPLLFAFRRLSILDLSPLGHQPMRSFSGRYHIVFNGEIYNFVALREELEQEGVRFQGRSDTEVLLSAIEVWGLNRTLQKISGMFAFALWDKQDRTLHFARDRFGKKPLYIGWAGDTLVFGSELKALRAHPAFKAEIDISGLNLFLTYGYIPSPACIYKNVWSLPAGNRLTLDTRSLKTGDLLPSRMEAYWRPLHALQEAKARAVNPDEHEVVDQFELLLKSCVRDRMVSDVPLGAFLSGGIDSSSIVSLMQTLSARPVKTYTIGFREDGFDEASHAKKIATHLGTDHHEIYLGAEDAFNIIPRLPDIYDEPFADMSAIPTFLVSQFARHDVTVALSGDGGDEMLGGYVRHILGPKLWNSARLIPLPLRKMMGFAATRLSPEQWDRFVKSPPHFGSSVHKMAGLLGLTSESAVYQSLVSTWAESPACHKNISESFLTDGGYAPPSGLSFSEKMMYLDTMFYLPYDILTKVDRASMAASLEARAPLLDTRIYDFAWSLPLNYKIRDGRGKWLLRQVLKRHVPESLFDRPKQGFSVPVGAWLRGPLREWAEDLLSEARLNNHGLLDAAPIRAAWRAHLDGKGKHAQKLWTILVFQAWHARWMER